MPEQELSYYCSNCKKLLVCKYTQKIKDFDLTVKNFNDENMPLPVRISITSNNYNCRHKDTIE